MSNEQSIPICEKDGDDWVVRTFRAAPVRTTDRVFANRIWEIAMWSYRNGRDDALRSARLALGVE